MPLDEISPGRNASCRACGELITFAGQDAAKIQEALEQLTGMLGSSSVKVTVKTKTCRPWWRVW